MKKTQQAALAQSSCACCLQGWGRYYYPTTHNPPDNHIQEMGAFGAGALTLPLIRVPIPASYPGPSGALPPGWPSMV